MRTCAFAVLSLVAIGCASSRVLRDSDGNPYAVRTMADGRTWTTDNLRLALPGSYCYEDAAAHCRRLGRLYTWAAAAEVCTRLGTGWRLPTDDEWRRLAEAYGGLLRDSDGRATSHDLRAGRPSGFNAVLGGNRDAGGSYTRRDAHGLYWSATESDDEHAWFYNFGRLGLSRHRGGDKSMAVSVRCIEER